MHLQQAQLGKPLGSPPQVLIALEIRISQGRLEPVLSAAQAHSPPVATQCLYGHRVLPACLPACLLASRHDQSATVYFRGFGAEASLLGQRGRLEGIETNAYYLGCTVQQQKTPHVS